MTDDLGAVRSTPEQPEEEHHYRSLPRTGHGLIFARREVDLITKSARTGHKGLTADSTSGSP